METTGVTAGDIVSTASVLREVNEIYRTDYSVVRPLVGGVQSGAWLLASGQGGWAVLKWSRDRSWGGQIQRAARSVERVRDRGYPTPAWLAVGVTSAGLGYQIQEYVSGRPQERLTADLVRQCITVLELHRDLDPDPARSWSESRPVLPARGRQPRPRWPRSGPVATFSFTPASSYWVATRCRTLVVPTSFMGTSGWATSCSTTTGSSAR